MATDLTAQWLAERLQDRTKRGIAIDTAALIRAGTIEIGMHLPAVRDLAQALGVSPATVSAAWSQLKKQKVIAGRGRTGVWVCGDKVSPRPVRFEQIGNFGEHITADLVLSAPDPLLLPDLKAALISATETHHLNSYLREPIMPVLEEAVKLTWPYQADAFLAADGGFDGMSLIMQTLIMPGTRVAIEDPTASRLLDILDHIGADVLPVPCDEQGPLPDALQAALRQNPSAFIYQPRTHSHCGHTITPMRVRQLTALLRDQQTLIIEDDGLGDLSAWPAVSLGSEFPDRTVHVRSYSKSYGPDLRLGVVSGTREMIKQIQSFRNFGAGWSSRLLQHTLAWLLTDPQTQQGLGEARRIYAKRRQDLVTALAIRGIDVPLHDGLSIWLGVPSEQFALVTLAARGIAVLPGEGCRIRPGQHIRISTSQLTADKVDFVADALALVYG
jgi:DNA-binding transcriptional MocR family regulator